MRKINFYEKWLDDAYLLSDEAYGPFLEAVLAYALHGAEPPQNFNAEALEAFNRVRFEIELANPSVSTLKMVEIQNWQYHGHRFDSYNDIPAPPEL